MATYNRSNILPYTIESIRRQTLADWELLVVGDACTDDSADVVAAIGDPRIRFFNLPIGAGEQSGPNNAGCAQAAGEYFAFLNHDDFWTPRHLARAVAALDADASLDLVYGLNVAPMPEGALYLRGASPSDRYEEWTLVPASSWVFRRALWTRVGPWVGARERFISPSQEWLRRAHLSGARLRRLPHLAALAIPSIGRPRAYADRHVGDHARWFARISGSPDWPEEILCELACQLDLRSHSSSGTSVAPFALRALKNAARNAVSYCGLSPIAVSVWARHRRRGGLIDHLRHVRGLPPLPVKTRRGRRDV